MFAKIVNGLKIGGLIVGSVGILFGVFKLTEKWNKSAESGVVLNATMVTNFDNINIRLNKIDNNIIELQEQMENGHQESMILQKSYINFVRKSTQNSDELYNILKDFIDVEKKSEVNGKEPEVFVIPIDMTRYNFTLLSKR